MILFPFQTVSHCDIFIIHAIAIYRNRSISKYGKNRFSQLSEEKETNFTPKKSNVSFLKSTQLKKIFYFTLTFKFHT